MRITIDQSVLNLKMIHTGNNIFINNQNYLEKKHKQFSHITDKQDIDSLLIVKDGFKPLKEVITSYNQTGIAIILDRTKSPSISVKDMPVVTDMPDPLTMNDGTRITTLDQWKKRRREMIRILEDYEYGHMPPSPGNVKGTEATTVTRISADGGLQSEYDASDFWSRPKPRI